MSWSRRNGIIPESALTEFHQKALAVIQNPHWRKVTMRILKPHVLKDYREFRKREPLYVNVNMSIRLPDMREQFLEGFHSHANHTVYVVPLENMHKRNGGTAVMQDGEPYQPVVLRGGALALSPGEPHAIARNVTSYPRMALIFWLKESEPPRIEEDYQI